MIGVNKDDARVVYADIIDLPHHQSEKRPHMSLYDRAAQFSPFAALTGYDDMVREEARLTDDKRELSETEQETLNRQLSLLADKIERREPPEITVTYFIPDRRKEGGKYEEISGIVKKIDPVKRKIVFYAANQISNGQALDMDYILEMSGPLFHAFEEEN